MFQKNRQILFGNNNLGVIKFNIHNSNAFDDNVTTMHRKTMITNEMCRNFMVVARQCNNTNQILLFSIKQGCNNIDHPGNFDNYIRILIVRIAYSFNMCIGQRICTPIRLQNRKPFKFFIKEQEGLHQIITDLM